jgi:dTMP kinase
MARGKLITIEGLDGAGKTTLALSLTEALRTRDLDARLLREPGGVGLAEHIRELVKDPNLRVSPRAEALLYAAARAQLVDEAVQPLLAAGVCVLLDRFIDSSLAYQGAGRELGLTSVREINEFATGRLSPDLTLLLNVDPGVGRARSKGRADAPDRLELESGAFFHRVAGAYRELAAANPDRIRTIDASLSAEAVLAAALAAVDELV